MVDRKLFALGLVGLLALPACRSGFKVPSAWELGGQTAAYHLGPVVSAGETGPRRFLMPLIEHLPEGNPGLDSVGWQQIESGATNRVWKFAGHGPLASESIVLHGESGGIAASSLVKLAHAYGSAVDAKLIPRPSRSLILAITDSADGAEPETGESHVIADLFLLGPTSGPCTLWRSPDPGGAETHVPANGLNLVVRIALVDVGMACRPWKSVEFAHDGGADHGAQYPGPVPRIYLAMGDSGVDISRTDQPNVGEADRASLAIWASAAALAGARSTDLDRYLSSFLLEARLRHYESGQVGQPDGSWQEWLRAARLWLRALVLGLPVGK